MGRTLRGTPPFWVSMNRYIMPAGSTSSLRAAAGLDVGGMGLRDLRNEHVESLVESLAAGDAVRPARR